MTHFVFFGRLSQEKGVDLLIDAIRLLPSNLDIHIDIFGDGAMRELIIHLCQTISFVQYHGFAPQKTIFKHLTSCHYVLMPSRFLETFGLSALEALSVGVPVIGIAKGGLIPFIHPELVIEETAKSLAEKIMEIQSVILRESEESSESSSQNRQTGDPSLPLRMTRPILFKQRALDVAKQYSKEKWLKQIENLKNVRHCEEQSDEVIHREATTLSARRGVGGEAGMDCHASNTKGEARNDNSYSNSNLKLNTQNSKLLLISDYTNSLGGIETYIANSATLLTSVGYETTTTGHTLPAGKRQNLLRLAGFIPAFCNIRSGGKLRRITKKKQPDIIWRHSVVRLIGRFGVWSCRCVQEQRMMYHDLGYFHPYPSRVTHVDQLPKNRSLAAFVKAGLQSLKKQEEMGENRKKWEEEQHASLRGGVSSAFFSQRRGNLVKTGNGIRLPRHEFPHDFPRNDDKQSSFFLIWRIPAIVFKFLHLSLLRGVLCRQITTHLVPSAFMKPIVERLYDISPEKVVVLPHFKP